MIRRTVSLHPEAIAEGREARLWYRVRSQAVEERFRLALKAAIAAIRQAPGLTRFAAAVAVLATPEGHAAYARMRFAEVIRARQALRGQS